MEKLSLQVSCVNAQSWTSPFGFSSLSAMERREDSQQRMLGSLPWIDSSLWDFAQNYSPQIERRDQNGRGTIYSLDSEKAIEPHISLVTECLS